MPAQPITYSDAVDTVFGIVNSIWQGSQAIVGYIPLIRWQGQEQAAKPPVNQIWARVSQQIVTDEQSSLANTDGKRIYHATGLLYIQLFAPRTDADLTFARQLAQYIREAFRTESPDGNVWFTKQRIVELAPTAFSYPIMISAQFEYDNLNGQVNVNPIVLALQRSGKHFPVEPIDGIRTVFTFVGLPADSNFYLILLNGVVQDGLIQNGQTIDFGVAPKPASPGFPADIIYGVY